MKKTAYVIAGAGLIALLSVGAVSAHGSKDRHRGPDLDAMFERFDADKDGKVTAAEVAAARADRFAAADADGDGLLSAEEMQAFAAAQMAKKAADRVQGRVARMIDRLDADEDGKLSAEELAKAPRQGDRFERMLERLDTDNDGAISKAELDDARDHRRLHGKGGHGAPWWMFNR